MSERYRLGVAEGTGGYFSAAIEDTQTGDVFPYPTMESAELGLWQLKVGLPGRPTPGLMLVFTALEDAVSHD